MPTDDFPAGSLDGMGGVTAELFKDTAMRLLASHGGLTREDALEMVHQLKAWPLLDGFRGRTRGDVEALVCAIVAFADMAAQLGPRLVEAEINPLFVLREGKGVRATDGVVLLATDDGARWADRPVRNGVDS